MHSFSELSAIGILLELVPTRFQHRYPSRGSDAGLLPQIKGRLAKGSLASYRVRPRWRRPLTTPSWRWTEEAKPLRSGPVMADPLLRALTETTEHPKDGGRLGLTNHGIVSL